MNETAPSFGARLALAWKILSDSTLAARLSAPPPAPAPPQEPKLEAPPLQQASPDSALQLLGLLQQEGRFIDFLQEDVSQYSDAEIGGAARVVHQGCQKVLQQQFEIEPISNKEEGSRMTLETGFDANEYRLTGNVVGEAPFTGTLSHRGWRARRVELPKLSSNHNVNILAPAELEL